jgi:hypothetical protein
MSNRLHDLAHFHGIAGWDFLKRESELIRCHSGQALEHRPKLLQHACFLLEGMPASQYTIEQGRGSLLSTSKSCSLRIREEDYVDKVLRHFHRGGVDSGSYLAAKLEDLHPKNTPGYSKEGGRLEVEFVDALIRGRTWDLGGTEGKQIAQQSRLSTECRTHFQLQ